MRNFFRKKVSMPKKLKGDPLGFFNIHSVAKHQKIEGNRDPSGNFSKSLIKPKKLKGGPLVSPGVVCYAEKEGKPFWFRSLGQMIQFGIIKFRRTFKNYFGQFVWIEKVTIKVAFHFMKRRLKMIILENSTMLKLYKGTLGLF